MFKLPITYSLRNMRRRPWRSLVTASGVAIIVFAAVLLLSLARGLSLRVDSTGEDENILVLSRAGSNLMFSSITEDEVITLAELPGIAETAFGKPLISTEVMHMSMVEYKGTDQTSKAPLYLRGVTPMAYEVHRDVKLMEGGFPEEENELALGSTAYVKLGLEKGSLQVGSELQFEGETWIVSGIFEAGGALIESEIWMSEEVLQRILRRRSHTFVVTRMKDKAAVQAIMPRFHETGTLEKYFKGWSEREYYREFGSVLSWIMALTAFMVVIITCAGVLIGANTMYTAVLNRMKEIATYRVLGFSKTDIVLSFLAESMILALTGGIVGLAAGLSINGLPLRLSYGAFYLVTDAVVLTTGLGLAAVIGFAGGLIPTIKGLRIGIVDGLRFAGLILWALIPASLFLCSCSSVPEPAIEPRAPVMVKAVSETETLPAIPSVLSLDEAIDLSWEIHPEMLKVRHEIGAEHGKRIQAGLWPRSTLDFIVQQSDMEDKTIVGLAQKFELGGKRKARIKEAAAKIFLAESDYGLKWTELRARIKERFAALDYSRTIRALLAELAATDTEDMNLAESLYKAGKITALELVEAKNRAAMTGADLAQAEARLRDAEQQAFTAVGFSAEKKIDLPEIGAIALEDKLADGNFEELLPLVLTNNPFMTSVKAKTAVSSAKRRLAETARWCDVKLGVQFKELESESGETGSAVQAGIGIDLPLWDRGQGTIKAAREQEQAAGRAQEQAALESISQLSSLVAERDAWKAQEQALTNESLPLYRQNLELTRSLYENGKTSKGQYLAAAREFNRIIQSQARAILMHRTAVIQLEKISCLTALPGTTQ